MDDNGIHLYETDPSGAYQSYHAGAIGSGRNTVIEFFEDNWKENMTLNAAMKLGLEALRSANDAELNREAVEVTSLTPTATVSLTEAKSTNKLTASSPSKSKEVG